MFRFTKDLDSISLNFSGKKRVDARVSLYTFKLYSIACKGMAIIARPDVSEAFYNKENSILNFLKDKRLFSS